MWGQELLRMSLSLSGDLRDHDAAESHVCSMTLMSLSTDALVQFYVSVCEITDALGRISSELSEVWA